MACLLLQQVIPITSAHGSRANLPVHMFNQTLYYNESYGGNTPCYNGNISAMSWKASGDTGLHGYRFRYDGLSRLTSAELYYFVYYTYMQVL